MKITVLIPTLNVEKYIYRCLTSVLNQTLSDIEIIVVDGGSSDNTVRIIKKFQKKDKRIKLIVSSKKSYGYQLNIGIKFATGKYISIVEPDDFIDSNAFETLYNYMKNYNLDVVRSEFYYYTEAKGDKLSNYLPPYLCNKTLALLEVTKNPYLAAYFFCMPPSLWASMYSKDFLNKNNIMLNETNGASFQDFSFRFKTNLVAKKMMYIKNAFYHYRQDNENSSFKSKDKDFCICDEIKEISKFAKNNGYDSLHVNRIICRLRVSAYLWNNKRINGSNKSFLAIFKKEVEKDIENNFLDRRYFSYQNWIEVNRLLKDKQIIVKSSNIIRKIHVLQKYIWNVKYMDREFLKYRIYRKLRKKK